MERLNLSRYGLPSGQSFDPVAFAKIKAESHNKTRGDLTGIDCPKCQNRGNIAVPKDDGNIYFAECGCMKARRSVLRMEKSGLNNVLKEMTFERFQATEDWQKRIKQGAMSYADSMEGWMLFCGQVGGGKSHLCAAVCGQRIQAGDEVYYMPWRDAVARLKALGLDNEQREKMISEMKTAQILYIDDLFKTGRAADNSIQRPTSADINVAFEIINYRYVNRLSTIISTESTPQELIGIDEATASRIIEMARGHTFQISRNANRNYRLRGVVAV